MARQSLPARQGSDGEGTSGASHPKGVNRIMSQSHEHPPVGNWGPPERRPKRARPRLEGLEERLLLYSTLGANWAYGTKITFSFVPDGTSIGGTPSTLYQTLNPLGDWKREFREAAAAWQAVTNINFVEVTDSGIAMGASGYQQGDPTVGDIRISAIPLAYGTLGAAFSPPPINGGSLAGDIVLNSAMPWRIDANYDLKTVAIHEIGHALGMDHTDVSKAVMYSYYTSIKQNLNADDIAGIRSVYKVNGSGVRAHDVWNSNGQSNADYYNAKSLDAWLTPYKQITLTGLDITTVGQTEWFWVTVPPGANSAFTVVAQSTGLSLMTPQVSVFDASLGYRGTGDTAGLTFGGVAWYNVTGVSTGQGFFIKLNTNVGGTTGSYQLQVNFGSHPLPVMPPPYTVVAAAPNQGGGAGMNTMTAGAGHDEEHEFLQIGHLAAWGDTLRIAPDPTPPAAPAPRIETAAASPAGRGSAALHLIAAAASDAISTRGASAIQTIFTAGWGGQDRSASVVDDALAHWGRGRMRGQHAVVRRRALRS